MQHLQSCIMFWLPRNSLRTHPEVLHRRGSLKGHPFPGLAAARAPHLRLLPPEPPVYSWLRWRDPHFSTPGAFRRVHPQPGCLKLGRGVAPPLTHSRPRIAGVTEGQIDRWGYCKVTHIGSLPAWRLGQAAEEWGSGGRGLCLTQPGTMSLSCKRGLSFQGIWDLFLWIKRRISNVEMIVTLLANYKLCNKNVLLPLISIEFSIEDLIYHFILKLAVSVDAVIFFNLCF